MRDERESKKFLWPLLKQWYEADEVGKGAIITKWLTGEKEADWLLQTVLEIEFFAVARRVLRWDDDDTVIVIEKTYEKFREYFRRKRLMYRGCKQFYAAFEKLLIWQCKDALKSSRKPMPDKWFPAEATLSEVFGSSDEKQEVRIIDIIPGHASLAEVYGEIPSPEDIIANKERQKEYRALFQEFSRVLPDISKETLSVMLSICKEAKGDIDKHKIYRKAAKRLGISYNALYIRVHEIFKVRWPEFVQKLKWKGNA